MTDSREQHRDQAKGVRVVPVWDYRIDYRIWRLLAVGWMAAIFFLSCQSSLPTPSLFWMQDKFEHAIVFGFLGFLVSRSFNPPKEELSLRDLALLVLVVLGYGMLDEFHQLFVAGRDASLGDLAADLTGGLLSAVIFRRR